MATPGAIQAMRQLAACIDATIARLHIKVDTLADGPDREEACTIGNLLAEAADHIKALTSPRYIDTLDDKAQTMIMLQIAPAGLAISPVLRRVNRYLDGKDDDCSGVAALLAQAKLN